MVLPPEQSMMPSSGCILTEARVPAVCSLVQSEREGERDGDTEELMRLADYIWAGGGGGGAQVAGGRSLSACCANLAQ